MEYNFDTLPFKTLIKIIETGDSSILGHNHKERWGKIYEEYKKFDPNGISSKLFKTIKDISIFELKQKILLYCVEALRFDNEEEVKEIIKDLGYNFNDDDYVSELNKLINISKNINIKLSTLKKKLPKKQDKKINIDEIIISYCSILSVSYDTNIITTSQFYGLQKNVNDKLKSLSNGK